MESPNERYWKALCWVVTVFYVATLAILLLPYLLALLG
jgi:hypothetical protein